MTEEIERRDESRKPLGVWVRAADEDRPHFEQAVLAAGAELCSPPSADAIVWAADEPRSILPYLHPGIGWVQLSSAGIEDWFEEGVIDAKRRWTAAKGVYARPIAEYALAMMLAGARRLPTALRGTTWRPLEVDTLAGKTVGIVGAGGIGAALIRLLEPFGVRTLALTRTGRVVPGATESIGPASLDRLLGESDHVVLAAAATPETRGLLSRDRLARMRPSAWLVNVARGTLVDTDALVDALRSGRLAGAALDVTDPEPLPDDHPLWRLPNAIVTSHTAGSTDFSRQAFALRIRENVARYMRGEELVGAVDPETGY